MGIGTTTTDMRGMGSRQSHSWHGQPGMRKETGCSSRGCCSLTSDNAAPVTTSCRAAVSRNAGGAQKIVPLVVEHPQTAGWHCERSEPVIG